MMQTIRSLKAVKFAPIVLLLAIISIAAAPAVLATPNAPTAAATSNAGEIVASWQSVAGAQFYTVGWINRNDYQQIGSSGDWLSAFHYATIPASRTSYTVNGLKAGEEYWTIIGARTTRVGGDSPSWSAWSGLVTTAGQHGAGFCPITGLPLPPGGYLSVGDTETFGVKPQSFIDVTLDSATTPASLQLDDGSTYAPTSGLKLLLLCTTFVNGIGTGDDVYFSPGTHNNLSTDKGIGFVRVSDWIDEAIPDGFQRTGCDAWTIPQAATTAVYAIGYSSASGTPGETLYRINLP